MPKTINIVCESRNYEQIPTYKKREKLVRSSIFFNKKDRAARASHAPVSVAQLCVPLKPLLIGSHFLIAWLITLISLKKIQKGKEKQILHFLSFLYIHKDRISDRLQSRNLLSLDFYSFFFLLYSSLEHSAFIVCLKGFIFISLDFSLSFCRKIDLTLEVKGEARDHY